MEDIYLKIKIHGFLPHIRKDVRLFLCTSSSFSCSNLGYFPFVFVTRCLGVFFFFFFLQTKEARIESGKRKPSSPSAMEIIDLEKRCRNLLTTLFFIRSLLNFLD
ncbi:hypothetical protein M9H77_30740 [Catharanthus roseus]|uniref:Uncharacterized protein n=1 Tax=Catharanthus roseus TaxID=4058 RepID=A0ACC0A0C9_CATRO|nr:hypothetical protein M9H77_30740 [Catharanthus roseus]